MIQSVQHAKNRKAYLERLLADSPMEQVYMGDSIYAEQAVEQENRHNQRLAERIEEEIKVCENYLVENLTNKK